ncbi:MAG: hypothetical protein FWD60_03535 [Candidatus Azobacteroides sp.]|nr:hypothetical protein [Candidatus Azobacteroides sp.]
MNKYIFLIIWLLSALAHAQEVRDIELDLLLSEHMLKDLSIKTEFINSIDYTSDGFLLLSSSNQFYILGIGYMENLFNPTKKMIESYTVTPEGKLYIVSGKGLCKIDTLGNFIKIYSLPNVNMGIASGNSSIYLFDQSIQEDKQDYSLFSLNKNLDRTKLVTMNAPIKSVYEYDVNVFFTAKNKLYCTNEQMKSFVEILTLPQESDTIISIIGDSEHHAFYISTKDAIYRIKESKVELVSNEFGGILKYDGEGLLVFNPEKQLIVRLRNNILYPVEENLSQIKLSIDATPEDINLTRLLNEPRSFILTGQISSAIQSYAQLVDKDDTNPALLSEYAYALALGGVYEGALMNLDRAKLFSSFSGKDYFYAGQVFALMDCYQPAADLLVRGTAPKWIYPKYDELYQKYKSGSLILQENDLKPLFNRANYLALTGMDFQSISLFKELINTDPDEFVFHIGYSIPLEKVGLNRLAADELESGILLMPDDPQSNEAKQAFNQRLMQLKQQPKYAVPKEQQNLTKFSPKTMLYIGGMFSENYTSFNSRFGAYYSDLSNCSVNLGISGNSTAMNFNIGFSWYQRLGNVVVIGLGLNDQISKDDNVLSMVSSLGFSFVNSEKNSSWDVFFNLYSPLQGGANTIFGISVGKTFYWGKR